MMGGLVKETVTKLDWETGEVNMKKFPNGLETPNWLCVKSLRMGFGAFG